MGGSMGVTRGCSTSSGPIGCAARRSRDGDQGAGIGAAVAGMRPIVEIMYQDFMTLAMEQLVQQGASTATCRADQGSRDAADAGGRRLVAGRAARAAAGGMVRARPGDQGRVRLDGRRCAPGSSGARSTTTTRSSSSAARSSPEGRGAGRDRGHRARQGARAPRGRGRDRRGHRPASSTRRCWRPRRPVRRDRTEVVDPRTRFCPSTRMRSSARCADEPLRRRSRGRRPHGQGGDRGQLSSTGRSTTWTRRSSASAPGSRRCPSPGHGGVRHPARGGRARGRQAHRSEVLVPLPALQTGSGPRNRAAPEPTLLLTKASGLGFVRARPLAWCSRPRSSVGSQGEALGVPRRSRSAAGPGHGVRDDRALAQGRGPRREGRGPPRARHRESDAGGRGRGDGRPPEDPRRRGRDRGSGRRLRSSASPGRRCPQPLRSPSRGARRPGGGPCRQGRGAAAPRRPCRQGRGAAGPVPARGGRTAARVKASPLARRIARERGIDHPRPFAAPARRTGSSPDVERAEKTGAPVAVAAAPVPTGEVEVVPSPRDAQGDRPPDDGRPGRRRSSRSR